MDFQDASMDDHDTDATEDEDLFDEPDVLGENYLILILRQLINSREVQVINSNDEDVTMKLPVIRKKPNLETLKKSEIYQSIKHASGYRLEETILKRHWSVPKMLANRERGLGLKSGPFTQNEKCKLGNNYVPNKRERNIIYLSTKVFCGSFSRDGQNFVTASQDQRLRVFDASTSNYELINEFSAKDVGWSILDLDFSPCGEYFVYATWSDCLHLAKIYGSDQESQCLLIQPDSSRFCVFSVAFSNCGKELIGGANDGCLYIYDRVVDTRTFKVPVIDNSADVNAVGFADETSNIFFSGGDDYIVKLWDRRTLNESRPEPVGKLIGHFGGITYIDAKNDGRHLISNSKDQSIKLWDMRKFSPSGCEKHVQEYSRQRSWDYRWDSVPKIFYNQCKPMEGDTSVMTYRGHRVLKSLIRAKFSPAATTGQRYIYTGCGTGRVVIYDVLTGKMVSAIKGHSDIVRDVSWHPKRHEIISCGWDYIVNLNTYIDTIPEKKSSEEATAGTSSGRPLRRSQRIAKQRHQKVSNHSP